MIRAPKPRFPILTHLFDPTAHRRRLEVEVHLPGKRSVFVLVNHFKSKGYGMPHANDARRKAQADRVAEIAAGYDLQKELVVVARDFNDEPSSAPLRTLLGTKGLTDVLGKQFPDPRERWTYRDKSQID
ncbi:MAG TPA: hypothetical protein VGJ84_11925 [Polyangiaceae bacterium]